MQTMLWEGIRRKKVVHIRDIIQHPDPKYVFESLGDLTTDRNNFMTGYIPIMIDGETYLIYKDGFKFGEKELTKAILNGYPIDTQKKTELTEDLLQDEKAYRREKEQSLVVLDI